jgi:superfamily II DNA or RNA helicase
MLDPDHSSDKLIDGVDNVDDVDDVDAANDVNTVDDDVDTVDIVLYPYQDKHFDKIIKVLTKYPACLDTSPTGTGKTIMTLAVAQKFAMPILVICPKTIQDTWIRHTDKYGVELVDIITYEALRGSHTNPPTHGYLVKTDDGYNATKKLSQLVKRNVLLVFDEVSRVKNDNTQLESASTMVSHLIERSRKGKGNGRVMLLSATPYDTDKCAISLIKMLGLITSDKLYDYDRSSRSYTMTGIQELIDFCNNINPIITKYISNKTINRSNINAIVHQLYTRVIKPVMSSRMIKVESGVKRDARNGYYQMDPDDVALLKQGTEMLSQGFSYNPATGKVGRRSWDMINQALQIIENAKVNTIVRLAKKRLMADPDCKVIMYFSYLDTIDRVEKIMKEYGPLKLTGRDIGSKRSAIISKFQENNNNHRAFISNLKVGGVGIELDDKHGGHQRFMYIIPTYNFIDSHQATGRIDRNDTLSVPVIRFIYSKDYPYEKSIYNAIRKKNKITRD